MNILDALNWRYATKKFDSSKEVSEQDIKTIEEVLRLSPSSYGLQPWEFLVIEDDDIKARLRPHSWDQSQITDCSHLIVLCRLKEFTEKHIDHFIELTAKEQGKSVEDLKGYKDMMVGDLINGPRSKNINDWMEKQVYLALGNALTTCAVMKIDSCPMEGFSREEYDKELGLAEKGLASVVVLAVGYRSDDDEYADSPKVRFDASEVIEEL